ncbi:MAG: hypothetical protein EOM19_06575, partial [Candidatus Moranbacteria bacterium]|nr:hypothetical protein [Candidatus Moranbacteria bacterium]
MNHKTKDMPERIKKMKVPLLNILKKIMLVFLGLVVVGILGLLLFLASRKPSHNRDWELGQEKLPQILLEGNEIVVKNLRDFRWTGPFEARPNYIEQIYRFDQMQTVDVVISHFDEFEGLAHIFLSFGFSDGRHISVSLETRREV